jgi:hypothetical protein
MRKDMHLYQKRSTVDMHTRSENLITQHLAKAAPIHHPFGFARYLKHLERGAWVLSFSSFSIALKGSNYDYRFGSILLDSTRTGKKKKTVLALQREGVSIFTYLSQLFFKQTLPGTVHLRVPSKTLIKHNISNLVCHFIFRSVLTLK